MRRERQVLRVVKGHKALSAQLGRKVFRAYKVYRESKVQQGLRASKDRQGLLGLRALLASKGQLGLSGLLGQQAILV